MRALALPLILALVSPAQAAFVLLDGQSNVISTFSAAQAPMPGYAVIPDGDPRILAYSAAQAAKCSPSSVTYDGNSLVVCSVTGLSSTTMPGPLVKPAQ